VDALPLEHGDHHATGEIDLDEWHVTRNFPGFRRAGLVLHPEGLPLLSRFDPAVATLGDLAVLPGQSHQWLSSFRRALAVGPCDAHAQQAQEEENPGLDSLTHGD